MARGIAPRLGTPSARFSLLFIEDLAQAVSNWLESDNSLCQIMELHDGRENGYSWSDVAGVFESLTGRRVLQSPIPGKASYRVASKPAPNKNMEKPF